MIKYSIEKLKEIVELKEGQTIEFKESLNKEIKKEICAFANSQGGKIFLGVSDKGELKPLTITSKYLSELQNFISELNPKLENITFEIIKNKFIIIDIPEGKNKDKPYSINNKFYLRRGPNSETLQRDEIKNYFILGKELQFDEMVNSEFNFKKGFSEDAYKQFCNKAFNNTIVNLDKVIVLENLKILREGKFTNTAVLLFCKDIDDFFLDFAIRVITFQGQSKTIVVDNKEFHKDIISNIEEVIKYLKQNLKNINIFEGTTRKEELEIPEIALREALLNAICHRDYKIINSIQIYIFDDRVEIVSPGGLVNGILESELRKKSFSRNPLLFSMLNRAKYVEKYGSGILRIEESMKKKGLNIPKFEISPGFFTVIFTRPSFNNNLKLVNDPLNGGLNGGLNLNKSIENTYNYIFHNPNCKAKNISENLNVPIDTIDKHIKELVSLNLIERKGSKKTGGYYKK